MWFYGIYSSPSIINVIKWQISDGIKIMNAQMKWYQHKKYWLQNPSKRPFVTSGMQFTTLILCKNSCSLTSSSFSSNMLRRLSGMSSLSPLRKCSISSLWLLASLYCANTSRYWCLVLLRTRNFAPPCTNSTTCFSAQYKAEWVVNLTSGSTGVVQYQCWSLKTN